MRSDVSIREGLGWVSCLTNERRVLEVITNERRVLPDQGGDEHPRGHEHQEDGQRPGDGVAHQPHGQRVQEEVGQGHLVPEPSEGDPDQ